MAEITVEITSGRIVVVDMARGFSGYSGKSGYSGYSGSNPGASGYSGYSGKSGYSGVSGKSGFSGASAFSGYSGRSAYSGYSGTGSAGTSGFSGYSGISGFSGYSGALGSVLTVIGSDNAQVSTLGSPVFTSPSDPNLAALGAPTENAIAMVMPRAGTARNLYVRTGGIAKAATPTTLITVRKNSVDTTLTLTMTETIDTTTADTTHSVAFSAGDLLTISIAVSGIGASSTSIASISLEMG